MVDSSTQKNRMPVETSRFFATAMATSEEPSSPTTTSPSATALNRLSWNLDGLLLGTTRFSSSDAEIMVGSIPVPVHRCILAARSTFFDGLFANSPSTTTFPISDHVNSGGHVGTEALMVVLSYIYTGKIKSYPPDVSQCVDAVCGHEACRPAVEFSVELMYASVAFQISELVSLFQRRLLSFVEKVFVEDVIPILLVAFHSQLNHLLSHCIQRVERSNLDDIALNKELPKEVVEEIRVKRLKAQANEVDLAIQDPIRERRVGRICMALDLDDVELVKGLLSDSGLTLDDVNALHYAAAYCNPKVVAEVLELGLANVNLKNARGYTPLHVAAMRREPAMVVSLLEKGASTLEMTGDGQDAVSICRRRTRAKDYFAEVEDGQESNKDRLCIDVLERQMSRNPVSVEGYVGSPSRTDDLRMKLLSLENRVAFARVLFPTQAKLAMEIAHAGIAPESYVLPSSSISGNLKEMDQNETPLMRDKRVSSRIYALLKTVELGRRYFPNCSEVLDRLLDADPLQKGTPDEQKSNRTRFYELKAELEKAFTKDKAESGLLGRSSSVPISSSSSSKKVKRHKAAKQ